MGLYLAVFRGDEELEGVEVGSYADFGRFRDAIRRLLERGSAGTRFPTLMLHSDCRGSWSPEEAGRLLHELDQVEAEFQSLPPSAPEPGSWQESVLRDLGARPTSLSESFIDIDGEPLVARLRQLVGVAIAERLPILFQ